MVGNTSMSEELDTFEKLALITAGMGVVGGFMALWILFNHV
jgi:hypothetical protein